MARSGVKAAGLAAASARRRVTASSMAARAPARSPVPARRMDRLFNDAARSGVNAAGLAAASAR